MVVEKGIVDGILEKYHGKKGVLISILQDIQDRVGYISKDDMEYLSEKIGISLSHIYGVITFYTQFRLSRQGTNVIEICDGTACHVKGSSLVFDEIKKNLGVNTGESTPDGKYTLKTVRCIGACSFAPVMKINGEIFTRLTPEEIRIILRKY
jgi:NADH:ubiquinone oxidoreductase subunit E